jgi:YHS domain-containing protein
MSLKDQKTRKGNELVKDPVCGMIKPKSQMKAKAIYKGKTYYFCWDRDKQMFEEYPNHWIRGEEGRVADKN